MAGGRGQRGQKGARPDITALTIMNLGELNPKSVPGAKELSGMTWNLK